MARLYHPELGADIDVADDDFVVELHKSQGWMLAPEPEVVPGFMPEPVTYAPVTKPAKAKPSAKK